MKMKILRTLPAAFVLLFSLSFGMLAYSSPAAHAAPADDICAGVGAAGGSCDDERGGTTVNRIVVLVIDILSTIVGIVAVIMIIWGGFKYITSGGDSGNIGTAKNTILFAIVGLIIVAMAQGIAVFVLDEATPTTPGEAAQSVGNPF